MNYLKRFWRYLVLLLLFFSWLGLSMANRDHTPSVQEVVADAEAVMDAIEIVDDALAEEGMDAEIDDAPAVDLIDQDRQVQPNATVTHVVDGDTIDIIFDGSFEELRVRMLGINTPETVDPRKAVECFGKDASNYLKDLLTGEHVYLEADPMADERDKYGRLLRNVYLADGTDINAMMVLQGYAYAYTSFPLDQNRKVELIAYEKEAELAQRGLWGACSSD